MKASDGRVGGGAAKNNRVVLAFKGFTVLREIKAVNKE